MKRPAVFVSILLLSGCVCPKPSSRLSSVDLGMNKPDVIRVLGTPTEAGTVSGGFEIFYYAGSQRGISEDQIVMFKNGKTISYGPFTGDKLEHSGSVFGK